jgi:uncharacterized Rmd1/YagE family protein
MAFAFGEIVLLKQYVATLTTREWGEKLAVSFALAKSSLLTVYEECVQQTTEQNSHILKKWPRTVGYACPNKKYPKKY